MRQKLQVKDRHIQTHRICPCGWSSRLQVWFMWLHCQIKKCSKTAPQCSPSSLILLRTSDVLAAVEEEIYQYMLQNGDSSWSCTVCQKVFKAKRDLKRHIESLHVTNHPGYKCDFCNVLVKSQNALRQHKNLKHPNYSY